MSIAPERGVRKMSQTKHSGMITEKIERRENIEVIYKITIGRETTGLVVFPETLEKLIKKEVLHEPAELVDIASNQLKVKSEKARIIYEFNVSPSLESYRVIESVLLNNHIWICDNFFREINDPELKTELKYAMKIKELDKMIDDLFELLNLYRMNEEQEDD
jgi:hypothetical protein